MNKYLITGFSGFVSHHFLNYVESISEPCHVLGVDIDIPTFDMTSYQYVKCDFRKVDLLDKSSVDEILQSFQPDFILHLASFSSVANSWISPVKSFVNNTNIFLNLVDQVRCENLKCRILSIGSSEEYGKVTPDKIPLHEQLYPNPVSPYAVARVSQEMLSQIYAKSYGLDIVLTRSFNHIGPGQRDTFAISSFAKKIISAKLANPRKTSIEVGDIDIIRDFVDVRDVVRAYYLLLKNGDSGEIYNICSGSGVSLKAVLQQMMAISSVDLEIKIDEKLIRPADNQIIIGSSAKIQERIGWQPEIKLEQSLKDLLHFWENKLQS